MTEYITARMIYRVAFPAGHVCCDMCDMCRSENAGTRFRCTSSGEILPFHNKVVGIRCPLQFEEDNDGQSDHV